MKPKFIFTLGGDLGNQVISEPEGWASIIFNLERDLTYWSLIENFELPLIFYGTADGNNGGYTYLSNAINNGIDTNVTIDIQLSFDDGDTYETCFDGRIDLSTCEEIVYRAKIQAAIVRNDLWAIFMANKSKPVDLLSTTDIYGNHRYPIPQRELSLPSQKLEGTFSGNYNGVTYQYSFLSDAVDYGLIDYDEIIISEIETKFDLPVGTASTPVNSDLYELKYGGSYTFNIQVYAQITVGVDIPGNFFNVILKAGTNTITLTKTNSVITTYISGGSINITTYSYTGTLSLVAGNFIQLYFSAITPGTRRNALIYGKTQALTGAGIAITPGTVGNPLTFMRITANTTYTETTADTILVHDAGLSICDRILGRDDTFYSEYFGGANSAITYSSNGCGYLNTLTRGVNIRGYTFSEKPFTMNFDDWWAGVNPVFNLGLGYEEISNGSPLSTVIRVEPKSSFFNTTSTVFLTGVNDIRIKFDLSLFTKTIQVGFELWQAETISGIDDPQTSHIYNLRYQLFGKDEKQLSKFIAASLAIEWTRRLTRVQSQDWRLDENIFIIALSNQNPSGSSPSFPNEQPELFSAGVTGLSNSETRINIRHTPARILERWSDFYSGQMQSYLTDSFKYASGEGNVLMTWAGDGSCDSGSLIENQNIPISSTFLFLPVIYSFTHPLTWDEYKTIRDNRKNAISISWTLSGVTNTKTVFIKKLGYDINKSKGIFEVWIKSPPPNSGDNSGEAWQWFSGDEVLWYSGDVVELL